MNIFAADENSTIFWDMKETDYYAKAATALAQMQILEGYPDKTFGAEQSITRAEMAAVVCRMIDKETAAEGAVGETKFFDVASDHWASGYINIASNEKIINGDGNGKFRPEDKVKYEEAIKMVVCALGFGDGIVVDPADWSKGYLEVASQKGISTGLKGVKGAPATRGDIAVMAYNGLAGAENSIIPATPVASVTGGEYTKTQKVALTTTTKGADIYYTTDGKTPTVKSTKYKKEISISKTTTLKAIAVLNGVASKDVLVVEYTFKGQSFSGGGGGVGGSSTTSITGAKFLVNDAEVTTANVGDVLTFKTNPKDATGTVKWTVGGTEITVAGTTYTVTAFDMGKTIKAEITGTGDYEGKAAAECSVNSTTEVTAQDIMTDNADKSPVVLTDIDHTTFLDDEKNPVEVTGEATLTLSIENSENEQAPEEISAAQTLVVNGFIEASEGAVSAEDLEDVTATAVDVNLMLVPENPEEEAKAVHPVGKVTVTLSKEQLGLPEDADLTKYVFSASHTNKEGTKELVNGELVEIAGIWHVRFELNGLSTIWIGNVPPRTVNFYITEEDADNKVNSIGSVVVKFGDFTPTAKIPTASRSGYLFTGWNYDMTRTPIISNLEVHALWIAGEKVSADSISTVFSEDTTAVSFEVEDGLVSLDCEEPENLPASLDMKVTVTPPSNTAKYYVGTDASVVAAFNDANGYLDANAVDGISFEVNVTDENAIMIPSSITYYYKWIDSNGEVIAIQEVKAKIANGSDSATSMEYTSNVDRGIGTFEAYLVDNDDPSKDYVAYINNHLSGHALTGYVLYNNVSFDNYRTNNNFDAYDTLKFVFTPFAGESYSTSDTISVTGEYYDGEDYVDWNGGTYTISGENLIVTYPFSTVKTISDYADLTISVNDVQQRIDVDYWGNNYYEDQETITCATWAEVVTALGSVNNTKSYYIHCNDSSPITLSASLTIPANVTISIHETPSFTIANGATLTIAENKDYDTAADLYINNGNFIVEDGGSVAATYTGRDLGTTYLGSIRAKNITFESGSTVTVPEDTGISLNGNGVLTFANGSVVNNQAHFHTNNFDVVNLNGTINSMGGYPYFHDDEININGTINLNADRYYGRLELYGTINVGETGIINVQNTSSDRQYSNLEIYGPLTNKGTITVKNGANAEIMNNGFVNYNEGTISVGNGCTLTTSGTKYINTGVITGGGIIKATIGDDYTNYDDGTEYVDVGEDGYWDETLNEWVYNLSDYSRYKYTHDPAETVDAILYLSEIINMGEGTCELTIDAEEFPEK
ncbi:MAG: S-layer homology domain-containing protein [Clostridia bacterium]|nr:S-layer homology domain-containing protein [Clostridia bacterium]